MHRKGGGSHVIELTTTEELQGISNWKGSTSTAEAWNSNSMQCPGMLCPFRAPRPSTLCSSRPVVASEGSRVNKAGLCDDRRLFFKIRAAQAMPDQCHRPYVDSSSPLFHVCTATFITLIPLFYYYALLIWLCICDTYFYLHIPYMLSLVWC